MTFCLRIEAIELEDRVGEWLVKKKTRLLTNTPKFPILVKFIDFVDSNLNGSWVIVHSPDQLDWNSTFGLDEVQNLRRRFQ